MESFVLSQRFGLDWKQAFGLRLWYAITSADDVVEAIHSFAEDIQQDKEPRPQPWFAEQGISALWDDPDKDLREDLLWGLLKLYADKEIDLADILRPENSQLSPLDNRLCWQLGQALVNTGKVSFGRDAEDKADAATLTFAWQLTNDGHWLEAVFVLLHLTNPAARTKAIQEHLSHHAKLIGSEQSEDFTTLTQTFKIPAEWVWQAKALYMRSVKGNPRQEVVYLLRAGSYAEAHRTFTKQVAPAAIIERDWDGLDDLLAEFGNDAGRFVPDWNFGGRLYRDFLELIRHVEHGSAATVPPRVVEGLMAGLPALHESVQVRQDADVLEVAAVADMASEVAKVVVELAKKGEVCS
jgi:nuclear pore complex protein Nup98-Nup96